MAIIKITPPDDDRNSINELKQNNATSLKENKCETG